MNWPQQIFLAFQLLSNAALLAVGTLVYCELHRRVEHRLPSWMQSLLYGSVFGIFLILTSLAPAVATVGFTVSLRVCAVVIATLYCGIAAGAVVYAFVVGFILVMEPRTDAVGPSLAIFAAYALAAVDRTLILPRGTHPRLLNLGMVALAVALTGFGAIALVRGWAGAEASFTTFGPAWIVILTVTIVALGGIIQHYERSRALTASIAESQQLLLESQRLGKLGYILTDRVNDRIYWSDSLFELRKMPKRAFFTHEEAVQFVHPEDRSRYAKAREAAIAERRDFTIDTRTLRLDGSVGWEHRTGHPRFAEDGTLTGMLLVVLDVTDSRRAQEVLRESQGRLQSILDNVPVAISLKDREHRYVVINKQYEAWFGVTPEQQLGRTLRDVGTDEEFAALMESMEDRVLATGTTQAEELREPDIGTAPKWVLNTKFPVRTPDGDIVGVGTVNIDTSERRAVEDVLRHSEERFRALIEHSNDLVTVIGQDGRVTYRSPSSAQVLGYAQEEVIGHPALEHIHPDDRDEFGAALKAIGVDPGRQATGRLRVRHRNGSWRTFAWSARDASNVPGVDGIIVNSRDVTGALLLEEQLRESQKMEAVGQLAGGIAHDFNNILGAILGFAGFLLEDLPKGTAEHGFVERIMTASERGKDIVQQILAFSRRSAVERKPTDLVLLMRETRDLLRASLPSSARLEVTAEADGLVADVNAAQISQILLNLCLNAKDALQGDPGSITVSLARVTAGDPDFALLVTGASARSDGDQQPERVTAGALLTGRAYARITVADTGTGMAPDVLGQIFDPFFTTKNRGHGTGLGLSVVHGTVLAYEGACVVTSRPGEGSIFSVYLPLTDTALKAIPEAAPPPSLRGRERVLVVDDEEIMADVVVTGLERLGYQAVSLNDPAEVIKIFTENPSAWDVVVSDQVMPGMNGLTLFKRLKEIRPALHFILCTGSSEEVTQERAQAAGVDAYFMKPTSTEQLAAAIRRLFDKSAEAV